MGLQLCDAQTWHRAAMRDPSATFFQTPAWHMLCAPFCSAKPEALKTRCAGELVVLPLSCRRGWGMRRYLSPNGTYAAPLAAQPLAATEQAQIAAEVAALSVEWCGSPYSFSELRFANPLPQTSHATSITDEIGEQPERSWSKDMRRRLRRGEEAGIRVQRVESDEDWNQYESLYRNTVDRWGRRARRIYARDFFRTLRTALSPSRGLDAFLARGPGVHPQPVAALLAFRHGSIASGWQLVRGPHPDHSLGIPLVLRAAMRSAYAEGCRLFDWGPSPDLPGVAQFKLSLGATIYPYFGYRHRTRMHAVASEVLRCVRPFMGKMTLS